LDQCRAVKFCLDPAGRERLLRHEGEIVKRVMSESTRVKANEHGIVPLVDAYLEGESPWLAYEYVAGGDLAGLIRHLHWADGPRRAEQALVILRVLASIVGRFHRLSQPIVHRDLKPANILLTKDRLLRITDFGISHVAAEQGIRQATISTPSLSLGETYRGAHTPIYASPQQKKGLKADVRDDVHALGIIGYQLLLADLSAERPAGKWRKRTDAPDKGSVPVVCAHL
ncbi:MAG: protein kinase domain-containing protein, partial [Gemmataceae bacterium]